MSTPTEENITTGVSMTAVIVAAARAIAASRPDSLAHDTYAETFVRAVPALKPIPTRFADVPGGDANPLWGRLNRFFGLRTRVFDDFMEERLPLGARQLVILAAGLDSRALRLDLPDDCAVYELDQPQVLAFKQDVLSDIAATPVATTRFVAIDLCTDWAGVLCSAGFDPTRPTIWLAEGLFPYLSPADEAHVLATLDQLSAAGSGFCYESIPDHQPFSERGAVYREIEAQVGLDIAPLFNTERRENSLDVLRAAGWTGQQVSSREYAGRYRRPEEPDLFEDFHWTVVDKH